MTKLGILLIALLHVSKCDSLNCGSNQFPVTWMDFPPYVFRSEDIDPNESADQVSETDFNIANRS